MLGESEYRTRVDEAVEKKFSEKEVKQLALEIASALQQQGGKRWSFGELAGDWLKRVVRVRPENEQRHVQHMGGLLALREPGRDEKPDDLTKAAIEECFASLDKARGGELGPAMLNKLRSTGRLIIEDARANRRWFAPNPFSSVKVRRVPRKPWPRITSIELGVAFAQLRPDRQREAIVMIHLGMRPGELKALQKIDVDLKRGFITIQRSNARDETKTGVSREVPIPVGCRPALEEALRLSPSHLVFPRPDGTMQRADTKLSRTLRTAFKKAGVVEGYKLSCRRAGCKHREERVQIPPGALLCPKCSFVLWVDPIPKRFTWYGLRHAAATLHRESGADALAVKTALGWVQRDVGDDVYTHLSDERYRSELNRLAVYVTNRVLNSGVNDALQERRMGFEPTTPSLGSSRSGANQALGLGFDPMLSVEDVRLLLKCSADAVYRLRKLGELAGVDLPAVGIRFHRSAVEDFVGQQETPYDGRRGTGTAGSEARAQRRARDAAARKRRKLH